MATVDDLKTLSGDLDTLKAVVEQAVNDLSAPAESSLGDKVLEAVLPVLEAAGWTAPVPAEAPADPNAPEAQ